MNLSVYDENNVVSLQFDMADEHFKFELKYLKDREEAVFKIQKAWTIDKFKKNNPSAAANAITDFNAKEFDESILLAGSTEKLYHEGDLILKHGQHNRSIFHIIQGHVRLEFDGVAKKLYSPGDMFGFHSFLNPQDLPRPKDKDPIAPNMLNYLVGGVVTGNYLADSKDVHISVIDKDYIMACLAVSPKFTSLFYRQVLYIMTRRIEEDAPFIKSVRNGYFISEEN